MHNRFKKQKATRNRVAFTVVVGQQQLSNQLKTKT